MSYRVSSSNRSRGRKYGYTVIEWTRFCGIATSALAQGAKFKITSIEWDVSMGCEKPYPVTLCSAKPVAQWKLIQAPEAEIRYRKMIGVSLDKKLVQNWHPRVNISEGMARFMTIETACRKCATCLENRRKLWRRRARQEITISTRTWFCTLTINPQWRFVLSARSGRKNFHHSYREVGKECTKYFKRLRKAGHSFRYVLVMEAHKDGYPHVHLLIHEGSTPIPKRELQSQWQLGYSSFKLVDKTDANSALYVTKYLSKDARTRIRASQKYGLSGND